MRVFLGCLFMFFLSCAASAQTKIELNEKTVVKDSAGTVYPYAAWQALISTNAYSLKPVDPKNVNSEFLLVRLTDSQIANRLEKGPKPRETENFKTGSKINFFKTSDIEGNKIDLKDSSGKIIVLNFWFVNCGPCRREIPELNALVDSLSSTGKVRFYGVALDDRSSLKEFLQKMPFKYTIVDNGRWIADRYGIRSYPTHVVVDGEGKVYFHTVGLSFNTVHWLRKSIKELLEKQEITAAAN